MAGGELPGGDDLPVAAEMGESKLVCSEHFQKARRPAAMLQIGVARQLVSRLVEFGA